MIDLTSQPVAPIIAVYMPAAQRVQTLLSAFEYMPAPQSVQEGEELPLYLPAAQIEHVVEFFADHLPPSEDKVCVINWEIGF